MKITGGEVYVRRWPGRGAPLILLHESLGCVEMWRDYPEQLARRTGREVIAYDRLGFGQSSKRTDPPSMRFVHEEAAVVTEVLDALGIAKCSLYGHSVGGGMAIVAAGVLGERCESVISESAQVFIEERTREGIRAAEARFRDPLARAKLARYHGDKTDWVLRAWTDRWLDPHFAGWSLTKDLPKMRCPALVLHGEDDEFGSADFPETIARFAGGPVELHLLAGIAHVPHREDPERILKIVTTFLQKEN